MTFNLLNRRLHLYLGLALLPWFLMYAVSSIPFAHQPLMKRWFGEGGPTFTTRFDGPYHIEVPDDAEQLHPVGERIAADLGLEDRLFHIGRQGADTLTMYLFDFRSATRVRYAISQGRLVAEDRGFRWDQFLTGMHARGGFQQESLLADLWGVVVDVVSLAMLVWIATGLYMWWRLKKTRLWGGLAIAAGLASAVGFVLGL